MNQLRVGIFVVTGLIAMLTSIFMLGSNTSYFQKTMRVESYFDSVQGLNKGAFVSLAGVKVGNVEEMTFDDSKNLVKVVCRIDARFENKLKTDSKIE
ncbi:MAG: MlaD family protein, partial [Bdellovibrionaceae bacterium]|nr:MlaD family protein [Pseudobdellovibrionaceae bacterium]